MALLRALEQVAERPVDVHHRRVAPGWDPGRDPVAVAGLPEPAVRGDALVEDAEEVRDNVQPVGAERPDDHRVVHEGSAEQAR
jgi:hypothetical protein